MRKSFGGGGNRGMGGGGGGMMKTFRRAVRAGGITTTTNIGGEKAGQPNKFNKKQPPTSPTKPLTLSSSLTNLPISASALVCSDESEWECVDGIEYESDYVFETVPSIEEVHHAVSALQQALGSSKGDEEVGLSLAASSELEWSGYRRSDMVYSAFHLLETELSVQRMVVSLSSDKAVWDAIMNNEVVQELRGSTHQVLEESSDEGSDGGVNNILGWILMFAKQLLDKIAEVVNNAFKEKKGDAASLDQKLKSSFFLSIVIVIIVVLTRTKTNNAV